MIAVAARSSLLSQKQVQEVLEELQIFHPNTKFETLFLETTGDKDKKTSLRLLEKTDFFTKEIDDLLLKGNCRIAIHSAKDLPEPLPKGLKIAAITKGLDQSDSLVMREGRPLESCKIVATSSNRREKAVKRLKPDLKFTDLRGNILERLEKLENGQADGIVIAEAALIRLNLTHLNRIKLAVDTLPLQGKLTVLIQSEDKEMEKLFECIDSRNSKKRTLYLGLDPSNYKSNDILIHRPIINIIPKKFTLPKNLEKFTHIIFTSKNSVKLFLNYIKKQKIIAIGKSTKNYIEKNGFKVDAVAKEETSEGVVKELEKLDLSKAFVLFPHSKKSRPIIYSFLKSNSIQFKELILYDTVSENLSINLDYYDKIIFTSPSTVDAFIANFGQIPKDKEIETIGPITKKILD